VNPNSKIPALLDRSGAESRSACSRPRLSCMHLARRSSASSCRPEAAARAELPVVAVLQKKKKKNKFFFFSFLSAGTPYIGGAVWPGFLRLRPCQDRIRRSDPLLRWRRSGSSTCIDRRLARASTSPAPDYTIADIAIFPVVRRLAKFNQYGAGEFLARTSTRTCKRWTEQLWARPAASVGAWVNRLSVEPSEQCTSATTPATSRPKTADELVRRGVREVPRTASKPPEFSDISNARCGCAVHSRNERKSVQKFRTGHRPSGETRVMAVQLVSNRRSFVISSTPKSGRPASSSRRRHRVLAHTGSTT